MTDSQPNGFLTLPSGEAVGKVLVLHAWWGLNQTMKEFCQRLAAAGFVTFAPDLYQGQIATTIPEAERLSSQLDVRQALNEVATAADFLAQHPASAGQEIAVIGFSLGAYFALELSNEEPERVKKVVVFYGTGAEEFESATAVYQGHFAADDPYEPAESVAWLERLLRENGRSVTFHHYSNTGHWFFESDRPDAYDAKAAELAWKRTLQFLTQHN